MRVEDEDATRGTVTRDVAKPAAAAPPEAPDLSVVVPAFNQASTIRQNLREIARRLDDSGLGFEIIVVSDGSSDATHAEALALRDERIRVLRYERNMGKGYALRTGSAAATGRWVAWIDSDLDLDPSRIREFVTLARRDDRDIVVGSKRHPDSQVEYPTRRRVYSWMYQQLVRVLFSLDVRDTQVGMKLFRREVLDEVMPVILVKRYAFDLEVLAVARSFGFDRISEAPVRLQYQFSASGVDPRAIIQALWDTAAVFYRLRLLGFYDRRRVLAHRVASHRPWPLPTLTIVLVPKKIDDGTRDAVARLRALAPAGTAVLVAAPGEDRPAPVTGAGVVASGTGSRSDRIARILSAVESDVTAFIDQDARPSDGWATAALNLMRDPDVGAVVGPTVACLDGSLLHDAAGILSESRLGVGGARIRHHVGQLREVGDFPAANLFVRTSALQRAMDAGHALDDGLCAALRARQGLAVLCSPDVVATTHPQRLWSPYLGMLHRLGRDRGQRIRSGRRPRLRHVLPAALVLSLAAAPLAVARGGRARQALAAVAGAYAAALAVFGSVIMLLHRKPRLAGVTTLGAAASHLAFGAGIIRGLFASFARRTRD